MTIVTQQKLSEFKDENTREIETSQGPMQLRMTPTLWEALEFVEVFEELTTYQLADDAFDWMKSNPEESFDRCFRGVVAHLYNLWKP